MFRFDLLLIFVQCIISGMLACPQSPAGVSRSHGCSVTLVGGRSTGKELTFFFIFGADPLNIAWKKSLLYIDLNACLVSSCAANTEICPLKYDIVPHAAINKAANKSGHCCHPQDTFTPLWTVLTAWDGSINITEQVFPGAHSRPDDCRLTFRGKRNLN